MTAGEDREIERELRERWDDMTSWVTDDVKTRWWSKLVSAYNEPHRRYHTLEHIHQMFQHYDQNKDALGDKYACAYAIFFHDIVYDPKASDNETKSAELFRKFSNETTLDSTNYIVDMIEATASHFTDAHADTHSHGTDDSHYFLDFDMAILGSSPTEYEKYCAKIRQEYAHLDDAAYVQGRGKLLRLFLQIPNIYATKDFRESYEERARENIKREIEKLEKC